MSFLEAILFGFVQGVTSFLPVSSSGHVILFEQLLKIEIHNTAFLSAMLNVGTLFAIVIAFWSDILKIVHSLREISIDLYKNVCVFASNTVKNQNNAYIKVLNTNFKKYTGLILISIIPTIVIGSLIKGFLPEQIALRTVGLNLFVSGILLLVVDYVIPGTKIPKDAGMLSGILCGICQSFAVLPGISRYGLTLSCGILCGYNKKFAVKYSFMISIPAIVGALFLELKNTIFDSAMKIGFIAYCFAGAFVACVVGLFCIKIMMNLVQKKRLKYFSFYCFIVGIAALAGNFLL